MKTQSTDTRKHFGQQLADVVNKHGPCCVGLDPHPEMLPRDLVGDEITNRILDWSLGTLEAIRGIIPIVKPQSALFERWGWRGVQVLQQVIQHAKMYGFQVVLDVKRGDIGSTAQAYVKATLERPTGWPPDAVTLSPYLGPESLTPFLQHIQRSSQGVFILVRTSNPGAELWQCNDRPSEAPAYRIARWIEAHNDQIVQTSGGSLGPVGAVIAATLPEHEVRDLRARMPSTWFLVPGYGAQGATAKNLQGHFREDGLGAIVVSARGVLFSPDKKPEGANWQSRVRERAIAFANDMERMAL